MKEKKEITAYSVGVGLLMTVIFSAAAAYLGLKVGQVFEAAIPISIIAVGLTGALNKKNGLAQNVIIQSIGSCSGVIVAGAIFTLPAIYILGLDVNFTQMFLSSLLGGFLGILFLIPFRKYFVKEMDGQYPFPEATATTQVLMSGEEDGNSTKTLITAGLIGGLYDFVISTFGAWAETISTTFTHVGQVVADKAKVVLKLNTGAAVLGLGYIVGLKYAFIICCGSFLVWLVIIPGMNLLFGNQVIDLMGTGIAQTVGEMSPDMIFKEYARHIGIGGIATAGIIGIIKSAGVIKSAVGLAVGEFSRKSGAQTAVDEKDKDLSMKIVVVGVIITQLAIFTFFAFGGVVDNIWQALIGLLIVAVISFLFTTVADRNDPGQAGNLEVRGYARGSGYRGWRDARAQQDLRIHRRGCARSPSGQCYGCRHTAYDERGQCAVDSLWNRCGHRTAAEFLQGAYIGILSGNVHSYRLELAAPARWSHLLVGRQQKQG